MTADDRCRDAVERALAALPRYEPCPRRADRIRERGHAELRRRANTRHVIAWTALRQHRALVETALAGVGALFYLSSVLHRAMRFYGF